jgi:MerR family mercuric resistance operon transcriptional regulator
MRALATRIHLTLDSGPRFILTMGRMMEGLRIGELAERAGVSRDTVRFYERKGLLPRPRRTASQYRVYDEKTAARLHFIRRGQEIGLTLEDIRELLRLHELQTPQECRRVAERLRARIDAIDAKIALLRDFRRQLAESHDRCEKAHSESCPVVLDLAAPVRKKGS